MRGSKRGPSKLPEGIERRIGKLIEREVVIDEVVGKRKRTLSLMKEKLEEEDGLSYAEKARRMGTTYTGNRKRLRELARIVEEQRVQEERDDR
jgi:hypothetical protein